MVIRVYLKAALYQILRMLSDECTIIRERTVELCEAYFG